MQNLQPSNNETALAKPRSALALFDGPSFLDGVQQAGFSGSEAVQILSDIARGNTKHTKGVKPETQIKAIEQLRLIEADLKGNREPGLLQSSYVRQPDGSLVHQDIMEFQEPLPAAKFVESNAHTVKPKE